MKYMGSKRRIAKHLLPFLLKDRKAGQYYVEPFVGGANMIDKVQGLRIGADLNEYLIQALILIRDEPETLPKNNTEFTEQDHASLRTEESRLKGFAGFNYSFGSRWLAGWARSKTRDFPAEGYRNALAQSPNLQGVEFVQASYQDLVIPPESIIYCDPPYRGTTGYRGGFEHDAFWQWCRDKTQEGHSVYISEYSAPTDFVCLWSLPVKTTLNNQGAAVKATEKLFKYMDI